MGARLRMLRGLLCVCVLAHVVAAELFPLAPLQKLHGKKEVASSELAAREAADGSYLDAGGVMRGAPLPSAESRPFPKFDFRELPPSDSSMPSELEVGSALTTQTEQRVAFFDLAATTLISLGLQVATIAVSLFQDRALKSTMTEIGVITAETQAAFDREIRYMQQTVKTMEDEATEARDHALKVKNYVEAKEVAKYFPEAISLPAEGYSRWSQFMGSPKARASFTDPPLKNQNRVGFVHLAAHLKDIADQAAVPKHEPPENQPLAHALWHLQKETEKINDHVRKALADEKAAPQTVDTEAFRRAALDATLGKLRPKVLLEQVLKAGVGFLASFVASVYTSYLGVIWNAIDLIRAVRLYRQTTKACGEMVKDYKAMGQQLIKDIQYTTCRSIGAIQYNILMQFKSVTQLYNLVMKPLERELKEAPAEIGQGRKLLHDVVKSWDGQMAKHARCKQFLDAKPAAIDAALTRGDLEYKGVIGARYSYKFSAPHYCFIPRGGVYIHCHKITEQQEISYAKYDAALGKVEAYYEACKADRRKTAQQCTEAKAADLVKAEAVYTGIRQEWLGAIITGAADIDVHLMAIEAVKAEAVRSRSTELELKFPGWSDRNVHFKSTTPGVMKKWATIIEAVQKRVGEHFVPDSNKFDKSVHTLYYLRADDILQDARTTALIAKAPPREDWRLLTVRTEYADEMNSVIPGVSPEKPEWQQTVVTRQLMQKYMVTQPEDFFEKPVPNAISALVQVPTGKLENAYLQKVPVQQDFPGPFACTLFKFVGKPSSADTTPVNFIIQEDITIKKTIKADVTVNATHFLRLAYSEFPGAPISALATFPIDKAPKDWQRIGYMVEHDKKAPAKCYRTRIGQTHNVKDTLYALRDYRILKPEAFEARVNSRVEAWIERIRDEAEDAEERLDLAKHEYKKWEREEAERERLARARGQKQPTGPQGLQRERADREDLAKAAAAAKAEGELLAKKGDLRNVVFSVKIEPVSYTNLPADTRLPQDSWTFLKFVRSDYKQARSRSCTLGSEDVETVATEEWRIKRIGSTPFGTGDSVQPKSSVTILTALTEDTTVVVVDWGTWSNADIATYHFRPEEHLKTVVGVAGIKTTVPDVPSASQVLDVDKINGKTFEFTLDITDRLNKGYPKNGRERTTVVISCKFVKTQGRRA